MSTALLMFSLMATMQQYGRKISCNTLFALPQPALSSSDISLSYCGFETEKLHLEVFGFGRAQNIVHVLSRSWFRHKAHGLSWHFLLYACALPELQGCSQMV